MLFPLESCLLFQGKAEQWLAPLAFDSAYLHAMIFFSQYFFDTIRPQRCSLINERTMPHFLRALRLLRERFADGDDQARVSDTTAAAVMGLAGHALMTGNHKSAMQHLAGLRKIVSLRGGVTTFGDNPKLLVEILR